MPTTREHSDILDQGPVVEARIFPDERTFLNLSTQPKALPRVPKLRMLVDTGANISALHIDIIQRLQLPLYTERTTVEGAGGPTTLNRYRCVLHLPAFGRKGLPIDILEGCFDDSPYQGVIGRDVLRYCKLTYDGLGNRFQLTAPGF
jgi:hypothetical protein